MPKGARSDYVCQTRLGYSFQLRKNPLLVWTRHARSDGSRSFSSRCHALSATDSEALVQIGFATSHSKSSGSSQRRCYSGAKLVRPDYSSLYNYSERYVLVKAACRFFSSIVWAA